MATYSCNCQTNSRLHPSLESTSVSPMCTGMYTFKCCHENSWPIVINSGSTFDHSSIRCFCEPMLVFAPAEPGCANGGIASQTPPQPPAQPPPQQQPPPPPHLPPRQQPPLQLPPQHQPLQLQQQPLQQQQQQQQQLQQQQRHHELQQQLHLKSFQSQFGQIQQQFLAPFQHQGLGPLQQMSAPSNLPIRCLLQDVGSVLPPGNVVNFAVGNDIFQLTHPFMPSANVFQNHHHQPLPMVTASTDQQPRQVIVDPGPGLAVTGVPSQPSSSPSLTVVAYAPGQTRVTRGTQTDETDELTPESDSGTLASPTVTPPKTKPPAQLRATSRSKPPLRQLLPRPASTASGRPFQPPPSLAQPSTSHTVTCRDGQPATAARTTRGLTFTSSSPINHTQTPPLLPPRPPFCNKVTWRNITLPTVPPIPKVHQTPEVESPVVSDDRLNVRLRDNGDLSQRGAANVSTNVVAVNGEEKTRSQLLMPHLQTHKKQDPVLTTLNKRQEVKLNSAMCESRNDGSSSPVISARFSVETLGSGDVSSVYVTTLSATPPPPLSLLPVDPKPTSAVASHVDIRVPSGNRTDDDCAILLEKVFQKVDKLPPVPKSASKHRPRSIKSDKDVNRLTGAVKGLILTKANNVSATDSFKSPVGIKVNEAIPSSVVDPSINITSSKDALGRPVTAGVSSLISNTVVPKSTVVVSVPILTIEPAATAVPVVSTEKSEMEAPALSTEASSCVAVAPSIDSSKDSSSVDLATTSDAINSVDAGFIPSTEPVPVESSVPLVSTSEDVKSTSAPTLVSSTSTTITSTVVLPSISIESSVAAALVSLTEAFSETEVVSAAPTPIESCSKASTDREHPVPSLTDIGEAAGERSTAEDRSSPSPAPSELQCAIPATDSIECERSSTTDGCPSPSPSSTDSRTNRQLATTDCYVMLKPIHVSRLLRPILVSDDSDLCAPSSKNVGADESESDTTTSEESAAAISSVECDPACGTDEPPVIAPEDQQNSAMELPKKAIDCSGAVEEDAGLSVAPVRDQSPSHRISPTVKCVRFESPPRRRSPRRGCRIVNDEEPIMISSDSSLESAVGESSDDAAAQHDILTVAPTALVVTDSSPWTAEITTSSKHSEHAPLLETVKQPKNSEPVSDRRTSRRQAVPVVDVAPVSSRKKRPASPVASTGKRTNARKRVARGKQGSGRARVTRSTGSLPEPLALTSMPSAGDETIKMRMENLNRRWNLAVP